MALFTAICTAQSKYKTPADNIEACFCYISCSNHCISYPSMSSSNKSAEFPDIQKAFLKSFLPEYEKYIAEHNPGHKSHSKDLKDWRVEKARLLMQDTCIQDLVKNSPVEPREWEKVHTFFLFFVLNAALADMFILGHLTFLYQLLQ